MELISMVDFVLQQENKLYEDETGFINDRLRNIIRYAKFLKLPLELWMFVPCDENGNIMKNPTFNSELSYAMAVSFQEQYHKAKERCLFVGIDIEIEEKGYVIDDKKGTRLFISDASSFKWDIESLIEYYNLTLTPTAIKQLI